MTPDEPESRDSRRDEVIAGEYVLGVLSAEDRRKVEARLARDTVFATMVGRWQANLLPLDDEYEPVNPHPRVFATVERRLFPAPMAARGPRKLWDSLLVWRGLSFGSVAALIAVALIEVRPPAPAAPVLTAELAGEGTNVNLVARYEQASGVLRVTPVAAGDARTKSLELWLVEPGQAPASLGVLPQTGEGEIVIPDALRGKLSGGAVFAVSIEPFGGSPSGAPTGPVIASGAARSL
ncbi:anti-sigma factor [Ensifer soli]|uniref:anti-sigma factor n=1 Tax=Ciceribacter sp. sgz301302 TaxID=3342379 RepID=UPI0035B8F83B